jgi:hypothetical protein
MTAGTFILYLTIPTDNNARAIYEKRFVLSAREKSLIEAVPKRAETDR